MIKGANVQFFKILVKNSKYLSHRWKLYCNFLGKLAHSIAL